MYECLYEIIKIIAMLTLGTVGITFIICLIGLCVTMIRMIID